MTSGPTWHPSYKVYSSRTAQPVEHCADDDFRLMVFELEQAKARIRQLEEELAGANRLLHIEVRAALRKQTPAQLTAQFSLSAQPSRSGE